MKKPVIAFLSTFILFGSLTNAGFFKGPNSNEIQNYKDNSDYDGLNVVEPRDPLFKIHGMVGQMTVRQYPVIPECTVFMIAPRHALLASHCFSKNERDSELINPARGNLKEVTFTFLEYGSFNLGRYYFNNITYNSSMSGRDLYKDFAIVELVPTHAGQKFPPYFEMRQTTGQATQFISPMVSRLPIGGTRSQPEFSDLKFVVSMCPIQSANIDHQTFSFLGNFSLVEHDCKLLNGMSGGPLVVGENGRYSVVGINIASLKENDGPYLSILFNDDLVQFIRGWIAKNSN